ncbi:MAG: acyl-CoA/acyl-ACP dehydrogenase [Deltaproteobacteria bacterium]|nr:acyl-CoA/acyl-ACP dehydrogenase [Deltaproteobacteria bacterium]
MSTYLDLNLNLTDEQIALKEGIHRFAKEVLRPASIELDALASPEEVLASETFQRVFRQAYELGYHTVLISDGYGGLGLEPLEVHIALEEMGWGSAGWAIGIGVACFPAFMGGVVPEEKIIDEIITPFCENQDASIIGCWAITEPDHGSDMLMGGTPYFENPACAGRVRARKDGDEWIISGQKAAWVSNGTIATQALCYLNIEPEKGPAGGGIAVIPLNLPGVSKGKPLNKMGQRDLNQGEIFFDEVRIPAEFMLCDAESYPAMLDITLATANAAMGAIFTGVARSAYELALDYARERVQGGRPIIGHQAVQQKLFHMFTKVETARQLSRAAMIYNYNMTPPATQYSIASKVYCTQAAFEVASEAIQLFGGNGLSKEYPVEKIFRDARAALIEDGSNDILAITAGAML